MHEHWIHVVNSLLQDLLVFYSREQLKGDKNGKYSKEATLAASSELR